MAMMSTLNAEPLIRTWRASGAYLPSAASKNGLVAETRLFLQSLAALGSVTEARADLMNQRLPQRSRETRTLIMRSITARLTNWNPPVWVFEDLIEATGLDDDHRLRSLLLLHHARQDTLVYDTVQRLVVVRWQQSEIQLSRDTVLSFLGELATQHPEVGLWSYETRIKIAGNLLTTLRDYGLLVGKQRKQIVEPAVDHAAVRHLARLLREEGLADAQLADHPDWKLWLMLPDRVRTRLYAAKAEIAY
jgi:hypothetical protein